MENVDLDQVERRRAMRLDVEQEPVMISWLNDEGQQQSHEAMCIDISRRGMLIEYPRNITIGTKVELRFVSEQAEGPAQQTKVARSHRKNFSAYHIFLMLS